MADDASKERFRTACRWTSHLSFLSRIYLLGKMRGKMVRGTAIPTSLVGDRVTRLARLLLTSVAGFITLLIVLRYICLPILEYTCPDVDLFETGIYGAYPEKDYVSAGHRSPRANVVQWDSTCDDGGLVLLTLDGESVSNPGPMIVDMRGNLVWKSDDFGMSMNTKIQTYRGQDYITFWSGDKLQESGLGRYYMLDSTYNVAHTVSSVGDVEGDLHEFKITPDGTAIITVYDRTEVNLDWQTTDLELTESDVLVDGIFQEIDIATGELLFEWRASDYVNTGAAYLQTSYGGYVADGAFDYFHINSVDKDSKGNYLVSLRHLHTILYIKGSTHEILWAIGGNSNDFEDLSEGSATDFSWQHDARWVSEKEGILSLFDNGMAHKHYDAPYSRGLLLQLDFENWTVELLQEYTSLGQIGSASQGNVQLLESEKHETDAHMFIGWGASAAFTEHTIGGELLCETHFGASWLFFYERVKSYRAFKTFAWKGEPGWNPDVQIEGGEIYVSWNGATEVEYWTLQGKHDVDGVFEDVDTVFKDGKFESSFTLPEEGLAVYRVVALDVDGNVLRTSEDVLFEAASGYHGILGVLMFMVPGIMVCYLAYRYGDVLRRSRAYQRVDRYKVVEQMLDEEELTEIDRWNAEDRPIWCAGTSVDGIHLHTEPPR